MGKTRSALVMASMVALGFSPAAVMAQPFPGGLPACLQDVNQCKADLDACRTARSADADGLGSCTTDLEACRANLSSSAANLATCTASLGTCTTSLDTSATQLASCTADLGACGTNLGTCTTGLSASADALTTCTSSLNTCATDLGTCTTARDACEAAGPATVAQLPATGQTACWSSGGALIPCGGTGQDGEVQAGAALSYIDNGNGTVTDSNTNLTWEKKSHDGSIHDVAMIYSWAEAFAIHIATLNAMNFAGYGDWRLPNVRELQSILDYSTFDPAISSAFNSGCVPGASVLTGSCTGLDRHWASTTAARQPAAAWAVWFNDGLAAEYFKTSVLRVRAVRGGL